MRGMKEGGLHFLGLLWKRTKEIIPKGSISQVVVFGSASFMACTWSYHEGNIFKFLHIQF